MNDLSAKEFVFGQGILVQQTEPAVKNDKQ